MFFRKQIEQKVAEFQRDITEKHIDEVQNAYREMRGWRHDYKNHIQTIKSFVALGKFDLLDAYLTKLDEDLTQVDELIKSGNVAVDAILNSKLSLMKSRKIKTSASVAVPRAVHINEVDLCVIIGNLLDNAIEACMKIEETEKRFARVYIDLKKDQLYISVTNSAAGKVKKSLGKYVTDKAGFHGIGLTRIDRAVIKNGGWVKRNDEEDVFSTEILIPLPQDFVAKKE